jgi:hypothetical protein
MRFHPFPLALLSAAAIAITVTAQTPGPQPPRPAERPGWQADREIVRQLSAKPTAVNYD